MHYISNMAVANIHFKAIAPWLEDVYDNVFYPCHPGGAIIDALYDKSNVLTPIRQTNNHALLSPCKPMDKILSTPYQINHYTPKGLQEFYNRILLAVEQGYTRTFYAGYRLVIKLDTMVDNKARLHITVLDKHNKEVASMAIYGKQQAISVDHMIYWEELDDRLPAEIHNSLIDFNRLLNIYHEKQPYGSVLYWVLMTDCDKVFHYSTLDKFDIQGDLLLNKLANIFTKLKGLYHVLEK